MIGKKSTRNQNLVFIKCLLMAFSQCLKPFERSGPTSVSVFGALSISYGTSISNYTYFCHSALKYDNAAKMLVIKTNSLAMAK